MIDWAKKFNELSIEHRTIGAVATLQTRIQHLKFEKARLASRYQKSLCEINDHINSCEEELAELTTEYEAKEGREG